MQFFKLVGAFAAGSGGQGRKRTADENVDLLAARSEAFNKGLRGRAFFYLVNASGGTFTAMAAMFAISSKKQKWRRPPGC